MENEGEYSRISWEKWTKKFKKKKKKSITKSLYLRRYISLIKQYLLKRKWFSEYLKEKYKDKVETVETVTGIIEVRRIKWN